MKPHRAHAQISHPRGRRRRPGAPPRAAPGQPGRAHVVRRPSSTASCATPWSSGTASPGCASLAVTSPSGGEGKTTTSHQPGGRPGPGPRHPRAGPGGGPAAAGRAAPARAQERRAAGWSRPCWTRPCACSDVVRTCPAFNLDVLPCGHPPLAPYEILKSPRLAELLRPGARRPTTTWWWTPLPCCPARTTACSRSPSTAPSWWWPPIALPGAWWTPRSASSIPRASSASFSTATAAAAARYQDHYYAAPRRAAERTGAMVQHAVDEGGLRGRPYGAYRAPAGAGPRGHGARGADRDRRRPHHLPRRPAPAAGDGAGLPGGGGGQ